MAAFLARSVPDDVLWQSSLLTRHSVVEIDQRQREKRVPFAVPSVPNITWHPGATSVAPDGCNAPGLS